MPEPTFFFKKRSRYHQVFKKKKIIIGNMSLVALDFNMQSTLKGNKLFSPIFLAVKNPFVVLN